MAFGSEIDELINTVATTPRNARAQGVRVEVGDPDRQADRGHGNAHPHLRNPKK
jgi:hypothetical protein